VSRPFFLLAPTPHSPSASSSETLPVLLVIYRHPKLYKSNCCLLLAQLLRCLQVGRVLLLLLLLLLLPLLLGKLLMLLEILLRNLELLVQVLVQLEEWYI
jgi:hypothetical protein